MLGELAAGDQIAILAGVVLPVLAGVGAVAAATVRYIVKQSRCLAVMNHRIESLVQDSSVGGQTHAELYERLRHIDAALADVRARLDMMAAAK